MLNKDFDLWSPEWLEIAFENKNRKFGAYKIRNDSSNRHLKSLLIVMIVGLTAVFLPKVVKNMLPAEKDVEQIAVVNMSNLLNDDDDIKRDEKPVEVEVLPPPPILKQTVQFTEAVIKKDEEVRTENLQKAQNELAKMDSEISSVTQKGATDGSGVNIDDIKKMEEIVPVRKDTIYKYVEKMPEPPGGMKALMKWLNDNIRYPYAAIENDIQGKVIVSFVVRQDGSIDRVQLAKPGEVHSSLEKEAVRLVSSMPKWIPGRQNGNPVSAYYTLPVIFLLK